MQDLCALRIKVIIADNCYVKAMGQRFLNLCSTPQFHGQSNGFLQCEVNKFIFAGANPS
jgi:hypothetical protein